jgi:hypothetical protein
MSGSIEQEDLELPARRMTPEEILDEVTTILGRGCRRAVADMPAAVPDDMERPARRDVSRSGFSSPFADD